MALCQQVIEWAQQEKRVFLRQALQARLVALHVDSQEFTSSLTLGEGGGGGGGGWRKEEKGRREGGGKEGGGGGRREGGEGGRRRKGGGREEERGRREGTIIRCLCSLTSLYTSEGVEEDR